MYKLLLIDLFNFCFDTLDSINKTLNFFVIIYFLKRNEQINNKNTAQIFFRYVRKSLEFCIQNLSGKNTTLKSGKRNLNFDWFKRQFWKFLKKLNIKCKTNLTGKNK